MQAKSSDEHGPGWYATIEECLCIPVDPLAAGSVGCPECFPHRTTSKMVVEGEGFYCPTCERTWEDDELRDAIYRREAIEAAYAGQEG